MSLAVLEVGTMMAGVYRLWERVSGIGPGFYEHYRPAPADSDYGTRCYNCGNERDEHEGWTLRCPTRTP